MILGRLLRVLGSRIGLVLAILAITVAATLAGTWLTAKRYVATSSILLELPSKDPVMGNTVYMQGTLSTYLSSQIELMGSERVVNQVIRDLDLANDPTLRRQFEALGPNRGEIVPWLRGRLLQDLRAEERNLLRFYFLDGMNIDQIGVILRAHRATIARRIAGLRSRLLTEVRAGLVRRLRLPQPDLDSMLRLVGSQLELSLMRLLEPR